MSHTPAWHALRAQDLHVLRPLFGQPLALDPLLRWWDLSQDPQQRASRLSVLVSDAQGFHVEDLDAQGLRARLLAQARLQMGVPRAVAPAHPGTTATPLSSPASGPLLLGLIDDGCAFLNTCFWTPQGDASRVRWLWDQGGTPQRGGHWRVDARFNPGRHLTAAGFAAAWARAQLDGEAAAYRELDYLCDPGGLLRRHSHGTHIASLAAGRLGRLLPPSWGQVLPPQPLDPASQAPIAVVSLPQAAIEDTAGRSLCVHVLSGIRYVMAQAAPGQRVVINLSLGQHGGPHDGSSLLEQAMAAEVQAAGGRLVIVTGAGNAYRSDIHAQADGSAERPALAPGAQLALHWEVSPDDPTDSFLEVWASAGLQARLAPPGGDFSAWVGNGEQALLKGPGGKVLACLSQSDQVPNGAGTLLHAALGPTRAETGRPPVPYGLWTLELRNPGPQALHFDAWIDRDDAPFGELAGRRYPSRLLNLPQSVKGAEVRWVAHQRSQSGLAHSAVALVAGAASAWQPALSRYSASGDGRDGVLRRPFVALPADESAWRQGLPGAGVLSGQLQRLNGSSVATALLSREVLNLLAVAPLPPDLPSLQAALAPRLFPTGPTPLPPGDVRAGLGLGRSSIV